ncbi:MULTISPECIES: sensor histidine kinase [Streptosporangium]|uniref:histidine kinase n=1 Tax=Streptosporangium brasiliense TaxID=47480 RepID=A0ABT9RD97_9ACTN|nr:ATP-binding protein [Streptosporangium brasiliense]MDP9866380.1 signal transduction histidine kinase [Streptosporangium brasiliense]
MSSRRISVRLRLTLVYGSLFSAAGLVLVLANYFVVRQMLHQPVRVTPREAVAVPLPRDGDLLRTFTDAKGQYRDSVMASMVQWSLLATVIVGVTGLAVGWIVARRALAPLHTMTEAARRLSESTLHERIALDGPRDELRDLADTFDSMLERLDHAFDSQRRFVANASHELRTPLAINRALVQVSMTDPGLPAEIRAVGAELLAAGARQERLIEGLLLLAQSERELTERRPVDLAELAGSALASVPEATADLSPAPATGDPVLLGQMIGNLLDNAVKYNDGRALVTVRTGRDRRGSVVTVENTGRVVPADRIEELFEPFRRLDRDRTGSTAGAGLGLSIVRAVARAHRGSVEAVPRPGGGLTVTVRLAPG